MHLRLQIKLFPWIKADLDSNVKVLQVPAGTCGLLTSSLRLVFSVQYFEVLKW